MRISPVTYGSDMRKPGRWSTTRSLIFSLPSSASRFSAVAVKALVLEAMANRVSACTGSGLPISRRPQPRSSTTLPSLTTATATPGTSNC